MLVRTGCREMTEEQVATCREILETLEKDFAHLPFRWDRDWNYKHTGKDTPGALLMLLRLVCALADDVKELKTECAELRDGV